MGPRFSSLGTWAQLLCGMWMESWFPNWLSNLCPALQDGFLTTGPLKKSLNYVFQVLLFGGDIQLLSKKFPSAFNISLIAVSEVP